MKKRASQGEEMSRVLKQERVRHMQGMKNRLLATALWVRGRLVKDEARVM